MSHIRSRRVPPGVNFRFGDAADTPFVFLNPTLGLHSGIAADELPPGFTPASLNYEVEAGAIRPRSGTSLATQSSSGIVGFTGREEPVLGGGEVFDVDQNVHSVAATPSRLLFLKGTTGTWTIMSPDASATNPSGTSFDYWEHTYVYDATIDENLAVLCNGRDIPKYFEVMGGAAVFSNFTFLQGAFGFSTPKATIVADNRLVFANFQSPDRAVNRVAWSARGAPTNFQILDGAGFEDLRDLRGEILALREDGDDGFLVISSEEVWRARPRRDLAAFDFFPVTREVAALNPRTARQTPIGLTFLSRDHEIYAISGAQLTPLGLRQRGEASRVQTHLKRNLDGAKRPFALYNERRRRYELFYSTSSTSFDGFPTRALYYDLEADSFLEQGFPEEYSYGHDFATAGIADLDDTWDGGDDGGGDTWDGETSKIWDENVTAADTARRRPLLFSSSGTVEQVFDERFQDVEGTITTRWRSGGIRHPAAGQSPLVEPWRRVWLHEFWAEYSADRASNASLRWTDDGGASFRDDRQFSVNSSAYSADLIPVRFGGRAPAFQIETADTGRPNFSRFAVRIKMDSERGGGSG